MTGHADSKGIIGSLNLAARRVCDDPIEGTPDHALPRGSFLSDFVAQHYLPHPE